MNDIIDVGSLHIKNQSRYTTDIGGHEVILRVVPWYQCNWCGKPVKRKGQRFCSGEIVGEYKMWKGNEYKMVKIRQSKCANAFRAYFTRIPPFKRAVYIRDNFTCKGCGLHSTIKNENGIELPDIGLLAVDHIHPYSKGGETKMDNLQTLCRKCNGNKKDKLNWIPQPKLDI